MTRDRIREIGMLLREYPDGPGGDVLTLRACLGECLEEIVAQRVARVAILERVAALAELARHLGELQDLRVTITGPGAEEREAPRR